MISVVLAIVLSAVGASPTSAPPAAGTDIRPIVDRAVQQYEKATSYEDTAVLETEFVADPPQPAPAASEMSLAFVRPNKIALRTDLFRIVSDGNRLSESVDLWMQYTQSNAPKTLSTKELSLGKFPFFRNDYRAFRIGNHPLLPILLDNDRSGLDILGPKAELNSVQPESLNGQAGKRLTGKLDNIAVEIWIDDATGLLGEIVYDFTKAVQASAAGVKINKLRQRVSFKNVRVNQPIGDDRFAFQPGASVDKVAALKMPTAQELQQRLVGRPAVAFTGKYLDGQEVSLDSFKGRVLLLDFWSRRCGPCIYGMPSLQKVADKYADKAVSVVGVNLDGPADKDNINQLLSSRKIQFRHLIETKPALAERYFVEGIPCSVLIDGKGIIQAIHVGMADERYLAGKIDTLLNGGSLVGNASH